MPEENSKRRGSDIGTAPTQEPVMKQAFLHFLVVIALVIQLHHSKKFVQKVGGGLLLPKMNGLLTG
jgi:hypothetical protein